MTEMRRSMAPSRYSLDPNHGYVGDPVLIKGLAPPEIETIYFGESEADIIRAEPMGVLCAAPPNNPGPVPVSALRVGGERIDIGTFTYED
jgi:hypothetical protein